MTSKELSTVVFVLTLIYCIFFRKKIKCPECKNEIKTATYAQLGSVSLFIIGSDIVYDFVTGNSINYYLETLFLTPALYYLSSEPKFYCRHCMKGVPFRKEYIIK